MTDEVFSRLDELASSPQEAVDELATALDAAGDYHKLFDAILLKAKLEFGLPLTQPTSFDDVPDSQRADFEKRYIDAARRVGQSFLDAGDLSQAWIYFRTIQEPDAIRSAIEAVDLSDDGESMERVLEIALYEGAHPVRGLEIMLRTHGTCNTITAMDQQLAQLSADDRQHAAKLLVRTIYTDLMHTVGQDVQQRMAMAPPAKSLRELIAGREWLFEEGNYHIDVSHLHSVVRFARALDKDCPELDQALQLAEYGSGLAEQFQYPGEPPFDEYYPAHKHYFRVLLDEGRAESLAYFRRRVESSEAEDRSLTAYVLVDLLTRIGDLPAAVDVARDHLTEVDAGSGFSFSELCREAGRLETLREVSRAKGDLVGYTAALIHAGSPATT